MPESIRRLKSPLGVCGHLVGAADISSGTISARPAGLLAERP
ncbi:MAG TPA: hypothetical protein VH590_05525 [Ktedonobacterales bacterium]